MGRERKVVDITVENCHLLNQEDLLPYVNQITSALAKDDSYEFIELAKDSRGLICNGGKDVYVIEPSLLLKWTVDHQAIRCAELLLEGKAGLHVSAFISLRLWPLHLAVTEFLPEFVELFIQHGAHYDLDHLSPSDKRLPLEAGVEKLSKKIFWTPAESVYGLIFSFAGNMELGQAFRAISHVMRVSEMKQNQEAICHYAREGQIIEVAILLYVDAISECGILKNLSYDEYAALSQSVAINISSRSEEEMYYLADGKGFTGSISKKQVLVSLLLLLRIFYQTNFSMLGFKASHAILAKRIEDAGFRWTNGDLLSLSDAYATKFAKHHSSLNALLQRAPFNIVPTRKQIWHQASNSPCYLRDSPWSLHEKRGISSFARTFQASQWFERGFMSMLYTPMDTRAAAVKSTCQERPLIVGCSLRKMWSAFPSAIRRSIMYA